MAEFKYTTDGRKVVVIGNLNSNEKIVQEIFVTGESEIPAGEHFVVKSLLDAPAISWKEMNTKKIEQRYNEAQKTLEKQAIELENKIRFYADANREKLSFLQKYSNLLSEDALSKLIMFLSGRINYVAVGSSRTYKVIKFQEYINTRDSYGFDGIKLASIYGGLDGNLSYKVNRYSDGSGSSEYVYLFETEEDANEFVKKSIKDFVLENCEKSGVYQYDVEAAEKYGFDLPKDKLNEYYQKAIEAYELSASKMESDAQKIRCQIEDLKKKFQ